MREVIIVPARYASGRLPGKPLIELLGRSVLERTVGQCLKAFPKEQVFVATDDDRIAEHCQSIGIGVIMTPDDCLTGTDRVACAIAELDADLIINVQGDEPVIDPEDIRLVHQAAQVHQGEVICGYSPLNDESLFRSLTIPKVVFRPDGRLLYMSRTPIPGSKTGDFVAGAAFRQICIYAFPRDALLDFASQSTKTPLESQEDIEMLRFMELGYEVRMVELSDQSVAVDVPEDINRAESAIRSLGLE